MSRHRRPLRLAIGLTLLVLAASVGPASAAVSSIDCAGIDPCISGAPDARIRRIGRTSLVGNDIYNTDAIGQTLAANLAPGDKARFSITIENESTSPDSFAWGMVCFSPSIQGAVIEVQVALRHGWPAQAPVSPTPTIAPGGTYRMRAIVSVSPAPGLAPAAVAQLKCLLTSGSVNDPAAMDAVAFIINIELPPI